jgi:flagellar FliL protein
MKADSKADAGAVANPKKKLLGMVAGAIVLLAASGGAAWYFSAGSAAAEKEHKQARIEQPEYVTVDSFTVNLQPGEGGDQYLQVQFTLQVPNLEQADIFKNNMAKVRSRVLLLLSGKQAAEINTVEGKRQLAREIVATLKQPFSDKGQPQQVSDVLFTAFIIQ